MALFVALAALFRSTTVRRTAISGICVALLGVTIPARAAADTCGVDHMAQLRSQDPARHQEIMAAGAEVVNGKGVLWKLSVPDASPSYLFGTMHVADPRILSIPESADAALSSSDLLIIESTDILRPDAFSELVQANRNLVFQEDDQTILADLSDAERVSLDRLLAQKDMEFTSVSRLRPWLLLLSLSTSRCEFERQRANEAVLDVVLAQKAMAAGKSVEGLETLEEQAAAMNSLGQDVQLQALRDVLKSGISQDDAAETAMALYLEGEIGAIIPALASLEGEGEREDAGYEAFDRHLIRLRNHRMAERAEKAILRGGSFIAVGALHLPGEEGLVELFRHIGVGVEQVE